VIADLKAHAAGEVAAVDCCSAAAAAAAAAAAGTGLFLTTCERKFF
jgi:hypothetical protein